MATYQSVSFMKKMMRTLEGSLQVIANEHAGAAKSVKKSTPISGLKQVSVASRLTLASNSVGIATNSAVNNLVII